MQNFEVISNKWNIYKTSTYNEVQAISSSKNKTNFVDISCTKLDPNQAQKIWTQFHLHP